MLHYKFEADFDIDVKSYWEIFFSDDYNVDLYRELKMKERKVLDLVDDGKTLRRTMKVTPSKEVPAIFRSVISDLSYTEKDIFHREKNEMEVTIVPAILSSKFDMRGIYSVKPLGEGRCRRTFEGDTKVSIMLIGGKVEKYMVDEMKASYDISAVVTRRWVEKHKAAAGKQS